MAISDRKEREFKRREEDILSAALSLFNRDDWQSVTIDQIAAKAEIGKGTVYKHFVSKDEIYAGLVVVFHQSILAELRKIDFRRPPLQAVGAAMDVFWRAHARAPEYKRLIRYCRREDFRHIIGEKMSRALEALDAELMSLLVPVVERGIRQGAIVKKPVESVMLGLHASLIGLMEMEGVECMKSGLTPEQKYAEVRAFALRGIARVFVLAALFASSSAAAATLPLSDYLRQVGEGHDGVKAAERAEEGARGRVAEGELVLAPNLFFEGEKSLDASPKNFPAAEGRRVEHIGARAGLQKRTAYGATGRLYYSFQRNDLNGADPLFVNPPSFYQASPVAEVSVDLWRNLFGRETRAGVDSARNRALARQHGERLTRLNLLAEAEAAYWTLSAARRQEAIALESQTRAEKLRDWVVGRVKRSLAEDSEGLEAEAVVRLRTLETRAAADARRAAERLFAALRGGKAVSPEEELLALDDDGLTPRRAARPDDVLAAEHESLAAAGAAALGVEGTRPSVEAFAAGSLNGRRGGAEPAVRDSLGPDGPKYAVGARVSVPLDFGSRGGVRDGYRREASAAQSHRLRQEFESVAGWRDLEERLADARARTELARAIEDAQSARVATERRRQTEGRTTTYFVLQAEQDWAAARRARVDAELGVRLTLARMKPFAER